jgi:hypothetical protein
MNFSSPAFWFLLMRMWAQQNLFEVGGDANLGIVRFVRD